MKYRINKLMTSEKENIRISPIETGYEEVLEGNLEECILNYRYYHADEGGFSWPIVAINENGEDFYEEGETSIWNDDNL